MGSFLDVVLMKKKFIEKGNGRRKLPEEQGQLARRDEMTEMTVWKKLLRLIDTTYREEAAYAQTGRICEARPRNHTSEEPHKAF